MDRNIIRRREVLHRTGLSRSQQWRLEHEGKFPARIQLSPFAVGWFDDEVEAWVHARIRAGGRQLSKTRRPAADSAAVAPAPASRRRGRTRPGIGQERD